MPPVTAPPRRYQSAGIVPVSSTGVVSGCEKEGRMKPLILHSELPGRQTPWAAWALSLTLTFLALALGAAVRSQEPAPSPGSLAEAARNAREHKSESTKPAKIFTNDDLGVSSFSASESAIPEESSAKNLVEAPMPQAPECNNPANEILKADIEAAQDELDQIRRELSYDPKVISDGDVDMTNFKPGSSGLAFGSPPLSQSQPQSPARVEEVILQEKIKSLQEASRIACDSPKDAGIQKQLDDAEKELKLLQREFDVDRAAYYSKPNYAEDPAGKAKLDAEQEQIQSLQSEIERLKNELPVPKTE